MEQGTLPYKIHRALKVYSNLYLFRKKPILIYTPGRVGSTGLYMSLDELGQFVIHIHTLDAVEIESKNHPGTTSWAYKHIIKAGRPADVITLMRDPTALIISDFFNKLKWLSEVPKAELNLPVDELRNLFYTRYFDENRHIEKLNWYDSEIRTTLGLDVYAHDFNIEQQYDSFAQGNYRLLMLRTESDDAIKAKAVSEFLNIPPFTIKRVNEAEKRNYAKVYKAFKDGLSVPEKHLETIYTSAYARHFFSPAERESYRIQWSNSVLSHSG